ncbi:MAG: alanine racemase [Phycisphaerales bacterium]
MSDTNWLDIDLAALDHNVASFRRALAPDAAICAVVKADAYGLGAVQIAKRLSATPSGASGGGGVELLAVFSPVEAAQLVAAGIVTPILVLMPVTDISRTDILYRAAVAGRLHLTIHSLAQLHQVETVGRKFGIPMPVHIELDTGMSRGGMPPELALPVLQHIASTRWLKLAGLFTHMACANDNLSAINRQSHRFDNALAQFAPLIPADTRIHLANTHTALRDRKYHRSMIRVGIGLLGYGESDITGGSLTAGIANLRPTVRWSSKIVHIHHVPAASPVGYGSTFITSRDSRLGIVPVGYAFGYPVALANKSRVRVGPDLVPCPIRGNINMDQLIVDLTDLSPDIGLDAQVEIYSNDPAAPNALPTLAADARTHCYDLLCRLSSRIPRRYLTPKPAITTPPRPATRLISL